MKKASLVIITLTLIFCAFALGFFLGRSTGKAPIRISAIPTYPTDDARVETTAPTEDTLSYPLDINAATAEDFTKLPGIGDTLAKRIVAYRQENGPFQSLMDLLSVEGIGEKKLEDILNYITIGGQP